MGGTTKSDRMGSGGSICLAPMYARAEPTIKTMGPTIATYTPYSMVYTPGGLDAAASAEMRANVKMATGRARLPHARPRTAATLFGIPKNVNHMRPTTKTEIAGRNGATPKSLKDPSHSGQDKGVSLSHARQAR